MIENLKISNFRLFRDEVSVRFRPITVFIGTNNAGKSTIIKFLLMLKQSLTARRGFFVTNGDEVKLGKFSELKSKGSRKSSLTFSLDVGDNSAPIPPSILSDYLDKKVPYFRKGKRTYGIVSTVAYNKTNQFLGKIRTLVCSIRGKEILGTVLEIVQKDEYISPNLTLLPISPSVLSNAFGKVGVDEGKIEQEEYRNFILRLCIENLHNDLRGLQHLSAIREELKSAFATDTHYSSEYVGKNGEDTLFELWHSDILKQKKKAKFLVRHTKQVLGIDGINLKGLENLVTCKARNIHTGAKINISEFGFGVSQCLPIFVQGLLMPPRTQLIVEQPEAQVHPTAQLNMGSFFAELWNDYRVGSIIETHSDNLLLRLRRLIAKGELKKEDVSIAYFTNENGAPTVKNLDINEDGSLESGLPMEFFGENLSEVLSMGVRE